MSAGRHTATFGALETTKFIPYYSRCRICVSDSAAEFSRWVGRYLEPHSLLRVHHEHGNFVEPAIEILLFLLRILPLQRHLLFGLLLAV